MNTLERLKEKMIPKVGQKVRNIQPSGKPGGSFRYVASFDDDHVSMMTSKGDVYSIERRDFDRYWMLVDEGENKRAVEKPTSRKQGSELIYTFRLRCGDYVEWTDPTSPDYCPYCGSPNF